MSIQMMYLIGSIALDLVVIIVSVIVAFRKKPKKLLTIFSQLPSIIKDAEAMFGGGHGGAKLRYALAQVKVLCLSSGLDFDEAYYKDKIEEILETPHSKDEASLEPQKEVVIERVEEPKIEVSVEEVEEKVERGDVIQ